MVIRNDFKGGTDWTEEGLKPSDLNDTIDSFYRKVYADNTGGSISNSVTETDLATITITQNDLDSSFSALISAGISFQTTGTERNSIFKLYVNGSAVKTITLFSGQDYSGGNTRTTPGTSFNYLATGLDSTAGNIIIKVTAQNSDANVVTISNCYGLTVDAINNND